jgi:cell division protein FtsB
MRIAFAMPYASWLRQQGRNDEAWEIMKRLPAMKDSLARRQKTEAIKEIQDRYDKEWATLRLQRMLAYAVGGIVALLLLGIVVWMYLRWKAQRTKRELAEKQLLIVDYSQQIERLSKEGKENSAEMRQLEKQLDKVRSDVQSMIYNGKRLMEHVKTGGNTAVWKKKDFENVIEYYRTVNLPFVMHLEKDYRSLTPSNMFMLLLAEELKYNDAKIEECMMMSPGALRTAKSRINSRHLGQGKD